jgi:hypothetical protein
VLERVERAGDVERAGLAPRTLETDRVSLDPEYRQSLDGLRVVIDAHDASGHARRAEERAVPASEIHDAIA